MIRLVGHLFLSKILGAIFCARDYGLTIAFKSLICESVIS